MLVNASMQIDNFLRSFLCHHYYIFSLSDLCPGVEKKISKEIMHFSGHVLHVALESLPGIMKMTILVDPSLVIITIYLVCLIYVQE